MARDHITRIVAAPVVTKATAKLEKEVKKELEQVEPLNPEKVLAKNKKAVNKNLNNSKAVDESKKTI